ncbi:MAG: flagellar export chaperone FlgN [Pseudomonadales bacterium]|jgi:flagellar biosynthesis/type III secretory pathway chaperone|nr:flagellar export chaperone FlgN [Pseudomonadales bacterium]
MHAQQSLQKTDKQSTSNSENISAEQGISHLANEIYQSLGADQADLQQLTDWLQKEYQSLEQQDHSAINEYAKQKDMLVRRLEQRSQLRSTVLERHDFFPQQGKWLTAIETLNEHTPNDLLGMWLNLETQLKTCERALQLNEKIITGLKQNIDRFMHILHRQTSTAQTYNASGETENFLSRRTLTQA